MIKYLFPLLFMLACGPTPKRNAEIVTTYEGIVEHHENPDYNTEHFLTIKFPTLSSFQLSGALHVAH